MNATLAYVLILERRATYLIILYLNYQIELSIL